MPKAIFRWFLNLHHAIYLCVALYAASPFLNIAITVYGTTCLLVFIALRSTRRRDWELMNWYPTA